MVFIKRGSFVPGLNKRLPQERIYNQLNDYIGLVALGVDDKISKGIIGVVYIVEFFVPPGIITVAHIGKRTDSLSAAPFPLQNTSNPNILGCV